MFDGFETFDVNHLLDSWADDVRGGPVSAGHFLPEEAPDVTARHLLEFLATQP